MAEHLEVSQRIAFSCCYILKDDNLKSLEAHNYKLEVTVTSSKNYEEHGRVITFSDFKKLLHSCVPHNCFIYDCRPGSDQLSIVRSLSEYGIECIGYQFVISTERLLNEIVFKVIHELNELYDDIEVVDARLREDNNSYVTWKWPKE